MRLSGRPGRTEFESFLDGYKAICKFRYIMRIKNFQLIISILVLIPIAFCYGDLPSMALPEIFHFRVESIDLKNIFRAMMGLYVGMAAIWTMGIIKPIFWTIATITSTFF